MSIVADTPDMIEFARLLSFIGRLRIETRTNLRSSTPTLKSAQKLYSLQTIRTKLDMLATLENVRNMVMNEDHILWPAGDGTVGLYEREELLAEFAARLDS